MRVCAVVRELVGSLMWVRVTVTAKEQSVRLTRPGFLCERKNDKSSLNCMTMGHAGDGGRGCDAFSTTGATPR